MEEQEAKDLAEYKAVRDKVKVSCFDNLRYYQRMTKEDLVNSGHRNKTNAEAMAWCYEQAQLELKKLEKDYLKKYPD